MESGVECYRWGARRLCRASSRGRACSCGTRPRRYRPFPCRRGASARSRPRPRPHFSRWARASRPGSRLRARTHKFILKININASSRLDDDPMSTHVLVFVQTRVRVHVLYSSATHLQLTWPSTWSQQRLQWALAPCRAYPPADCRSFRATRIAHTSGALSDATGRSTRTSTYAVMLILYKYYIRIPASYAI